MRRYRRSEQVYGHSFSGTGDLFNSTTPSTAVSGLSVGDNVFSWTVSNGACDPVTDMIVVKVNNLIVPTLITPNQDGRNDFFVLARAGNSWQDRVDHLRPPWTEGLKTVITRMTGMALTTTAIPLPMTPTSGS
jgi:hypothetical protein